MHKKCLHNRPGATAAFFSNARGGAYFVDFSYAMEGSRLAGEAGGSIKPGPARFKRSMKLTYSEFSIRKSTRLSCFMPSKS